MTQTETQALTVLRVHADDTVAVAVDALAAGTTVEVAGRAVVLADDVSAGHKLALVGHDEGEAVVKYGFPVGRATAPIAPGDWVHSHNLATALTGEETYHFHQPFVPQSSEATATLTFEGYERPDGRVGTRNELWVLNTVGCVNRAAERIARMADRRYGPAGAGLIDGAHSFSHPFGCSQLGDDLQYTRTILAALARHPNCSGVLVLGLGCENNQLAAFVEAADPDGSRRAAGRLKAITAQLVDDEIEAGMEAVDALVEVMQHDRRTTVPASRLVLGMKCGGSDGFSGLTANPLVGRISDRMAALGGRVVLTEVPEMFGAEQVLLDRAMSRPVFDATVAMIDGFKRYFLDHDQPVYENPSPGNKDGGLTTLEEKSLGAIQKGGRAPVAEVVAYGHQASVVGSEGFTPGLALLEAPGNDGVSATALTAAGATLVLFTTGRGTPLGFPAPTVKIATNPDLAARKPHWIDASAGPLLTGEADVDTLTDTFLADLLAIASGRRTNNETNDYREIAIWKHGVTL
ncbi:MAG: altronate dehydratase family protein [Bacteroidota bacterium]